MEQDTQATPSEQQMPVVMHGNRAVKTWCLEDIGAHGRYETTVPAEPPAFIVERQKRPAPDKTARQIPLIRSNPPRLSLLSGALASIERSGIYSNFGPVNANFEAEIVEVMFNASGSCVTVANATLGLMLAIKQAIGWQPHGRYALMPSFTFAAAAQAALWCGLTPLFCDIDRTTWLPDAAAEDELLRRYGDEIAVILPNATFGNCLDLARYERLSITHGIPLVIDAAAALGSLNIKGEAFGTGSRSPLVFSMHATKAFATGEGGLIYAADPEKIAGLRSMAGFGLNADRLVTLPGLNAKLTEVAALLALMKLQDIGGIAEHRFKLHRLYASLLPDFTFQGMTGQRSALQFVSVLLPEGCTKQAPEITAELFQHGIGSRNYFAPHLANHPLFRSHCVAGDLTVTDEISRRVISLPVSDVLRAEDVRRICEIFRYVCQPPRLRMAFNASRA